MGLKDAGSGREITRRVFASSIVAASVSTGWAGRAFAVFDPPPAPQLPGNYVPPPGQHPFVFATPDKLRRFLDVQTGSCIKARAVLERRVKAALDNPARYTTPFDGCKLDTYLHQLTYEYGGAARIAADLANYSYLTYLNIGYGNSALAEKARGLAKQILNRWSVAGFRDNGRLRTRLSDFCNEKGESDQGTKFSIGLTIGRGISNWVHAQDLLSALNLFSESESKRLDQFLSGMSFIIASALNYRAQGSNLDCNRYSNHLSVQLTALIAIARIRNDKNSFEDAADGRHGGIAISWTSQVSRAVYDYHAIQLNCYKNGDSVDYYQNSKIQPGEIVDRFRAKEPQTLGYPLYSLTNLLTSDMLLRSAGLIDPFSPNKSEDLLRLSLGFYGGFYSSLLTGEKSDVPPLFDYPGVAQYQGKLLTSGNGSTIEGSDNMLLPFLIASKVFPNDQAVMKVMQKAQDFAPRYLAFCDVGPIYLPLIK